MQRQAYIVSAGLHIGGLILLFLLAQIPAQNSPLLRRYQPVRLVALPGLPGAAVHAPSADKAKAKEEPKPKPAVKSDAKAKPEQKAPASAQPAGSAGTGGSGARLEGVNFPYPYYLSNIQIKILSNFKPAISSKEAKNLKAVIYFMVNKAGRISDVKLEEKSGHFLFDQEAQRAVLRSNPLPALPGAFGSDRLGVHFEFVGSP